MAENVREIRKDILEIKESMHDMKDFFRDIIANYAKEADEKYALKTEHKENADKIKSIESFHKDIMKVVVGILGAGVVGVIGILWQNIGKIIQ